MSIKNTAKLAEVFRGYVIKLFVDRGLLDRSFALKILSWHHSGFSVDNSVPIPASSRKTRVNLSQFIIRNPVSLKLFKAGDFIAELTQHIPPKHKHLIRYYGLYSSRTKGKANKDGSLTKYGYTPAPKKTPEHAADPEMETVSNKASRRDSGAAHTKDLRSRPSDLSKMRSLDESDCSLSPILTRYE